ncbi:50S ribosomal protein L33 [Streptomyces lydicus]
MLAPWPATNYLELRKYDPVAGRHVTFREER